MILAVNESLVSRVAAWCEACEPDVSTSSSAAKTFIPACCDPGPVQIVDTGAWRWIGGYLIGKGGGGVMRGIHTYTHCSDARPEGAKSK